MFNTGVNNAFGQPQGGGFGQTAAGSYGQPTAGAFGATGGFGQPAGGGFGQQQAGAFGQQQAGGFGQQQVGGFGAAGRGASGFGQQQAGAFGQQQAGGFGQQQAGGFGQQQAGGFGQQQAGGFGQQQAGGFGQQQAGGLGTAGRGASGFGQPAGGSFGQQQAGGFGQPSGGAFGQQQAGGFGQQAGAFGQQQAGGFGQQQAGGFGGAGRGTSGFGQPAAGGFGQQQAGGFGQPSSGTFGQQQAGGFGQPAGGGFGQQQAGGFGAAGRGTSGFGQPAAGGAFGQQQAGGFGQPSSGTFGQQQAGGFGQPAGGGFGQQQAGGFGAAGRGTSGFGQPAAGGAFGQQQAGGFGQPSSGTFGQQQAGGFGQPAGGGFGQQTGGFGQPAGGGFGQQTGGFGQPAGGGFGQQTGGFGQPAVGGFGQPAAGGFGQAAAGGCGYPSPVSYIPPKEPACMALPDFNSNPYGKVLLFSHYERPDVDKLAKESKESNKLDVLSKDGLGGLQEACSTWVPSSSPPKSSKMEALKEEAAAIGVSALSSAALRDILTPSIRFGVSPPEPEKVESVDGAVNDPQVEEGGGALSPLCPTCASHAYVLSPSLEDLSQRSASELRSIYPFSIARKDGRVLVEFLRPVNLLQVEITECIHLSAKGEVSFYDLPGPSRGSSAVDGAAAGLMVPARVSVFGVVNITEAELRAQNERTRSIFLSYEKNVWQYVMNDGGENHGRSELAKASDPFSIPEELHREIVHEVVGEGDRRLAPEGEIGLSALPAEGSTTAEILLRHQEAACASALLSHTRAPEHTIHPYLDPTTVGSTTRSGTSPAREMIKKDLTRSKKQGFQLTYNLDTEKSHRHDRSQGSTKPSLTCGKNLISDLVYMQSIDDSVIHQKGIAHACSTSPGEGSPLTAKENTSISSAISLSRSFRGAWDGSGRVAIPSFSVLKDVREEDFEKSHGREVAGARIQLQSVLRHQQDEQSLIPHVTLALLQTLRNYMKVETPTSSGGTIPTFIAVHLHRRNSLVTLSDPILTALNVSVKHAATTVENYLSKENKKSSREELLSVAQCHSTISLLQALYGLPEEDHPVSNAAEEQRYLRQLRHRNLSLWVEEELSTLLKSNEHLEVLSPEDQLMQLLLSHRLNEAREVVRRHVGETEFSRVLRLSGKGNQFGSFVDMLRQLRGSDAEKSGVSGFQIREEVVSLLSGRIAPFISTPEYRIERETNATQTWKLPEVQAEPRAAVWKQLLGAFLFFGCTPDTPAEEVIEDFMSRLKEVGNANGKEVRYPLPPYAQRVADSLLASRSGRDLVVRGSQFPDATFLLLDAFRAGTAPTSVALHPCASSYCPSDFLTPLMIIVAMRSIGLQRTISYQDAEVSSLKGLAGYLETLEKVWFWALLPLHMIEDDCMRSSAVHSFCSRNALRASLFVPTDARYTVFQELIQWLAVPTGWLQPVKLDEVTELTKDRVNQPSLLVHEAIHDSMLRVSSTVAQQVKEA